MATSNGATTLLLRMGEAARLLNISRSRAYELAAKGELPGVVRIGTSMRIHRPTLERWLEKQARQHDVA